MAHPAQKNGKRFLPSAYKSEKYQVEDGLEQNPNIESFFSDC